MTQDIKLSDLIDIKTLQTIQDQFSKMTGMAALTTDENGMPVTKPSNFTRFCTITRNSKTGCKRCIQCDSFSANNALEEGDAKAYVCHAGIKEFSAPIIANGKLIGCFLGGQVLTEPPDPEAFKVIAEEINTDPEEYSRAACEVKVISEQQLQNSADFLFTIGNILSDMAYGKYIAIQAGYEIQRAAQLKTDFLANMSHEIRTPMNAVIGMAELALREEISPQAVNYIQQIKSSGKSLLSIINDILDFSKIESGKLDIIKEEYEPLTLFNEVAAIIMTRLENKSVELIMDLNPDIPQKLTGDSLRIRQILINIMNNAAKFTSKGHIKVSVDFEDSEFDEIILQVCVEDTGIGIKSEDLSRIFNSFQQLDSKRNRNLEGTGLGLTISKQLLSLMDGKIWVESEYKKGSRFYFWIPQEVSARGSSLKVTEPEKLTVCAQIDSPDIKDQFIKDMLRLKVPYKVLKKDFSLKKGLEAIRKTQGNCHIYFFIQKEKLTEEDKTVLEQNENVTGVLLTDFFSAEKFNIKNLIAVKKPVSAITTALVLNHKLTVEDKNTDSDFGFTAPDAKILVVDDNSINISVTKGLLEPLKMHIDCVLSGKAALQKIKSEKYDLIFMDHMMPEMDGVETTLAIRQQFPDYDSVPIIALTANAVGNVRDLFIRSGMNDFVAKPIELRLITAKVRQWLPASKIIRQSLSKENSEKESPLPILGDLDVKRAVKLLGSKTLFDTIIKEFFRTINTKAQAIKEYEKNEDWTAYTIEVHALKSTAKQIGAYSLSEKAASLEKAGNQKDSVMIHMQTDALLRQYGAYISVLSPYCNPGSAKKTDTKEISREKLLEYLNRIKVLSEDLNIDKIESIARKLEDYRISEIETSLLRKLLEATQNYDVTEIEKIIDEWKNILN